MPSFVHLHCHSHYSLLDGASRVPELVARARELGMNAIALTDHGTLCGAIDFYRECRAAGLNPIIGYEAYVAANRLTDRDARRRGEAAYHLTLLACNRAGFRNLVRMASIAYLDGYHYVPRIDKQLLAAHAEGVICLSGCASGEFSEFILKNQLEEASTLAAWFARLFGDRFYVEIQNNGLDIQRRCAEAATDIAKRLGLPLVATSDAHYLCQQDSTAHDVLLCINTGKTRSAENRLKYGTDQFYVRSPEEMYALFADQPDAVARTQEIADRCSIELDFGTRHFPVFTSPENKEPETYLRELCEEGLRQRYGPQPSAEAIERLGHELGIICRMGFAGYFLIVWDFVRFGRENGIPASARGSACGSIVSYVLKLSHVDPLEYDLLFERFLDPDRNEAPDIDIDFCQEGRDRVIDYVRRKYGEESVAQIGTFSTMAARAAVKDVGRVLDIPLARVTQISEMIPKTLGITLDDALKQNPDLRKEYENDPAVRELIDIARRLEGTNRAIGTHAAGVVIANGPLTEHVPLQRVARKDDDTGNRRDEAVTTQWVMGDLEQIGLLKMDFLGLRTLTCLANAVALIAKTAGKRIDLEKLPLDDAVTFAMLQRGDARGVFQFESDGIRELLKRMRPDSIRDLIACNALYRPGPLGGGMVDTYINRKHGREMPKYAHPVMEEILRETYGVMVYQEQVMRILNRLGGIELSSAYACIKAISKKKHDVIAERRLEFLEGASRRGLSPSVAAEIFDQITYFGGYGFNKSHSTAYALIGYQTAYLKAHYPAEFMAALLSSEIDDGNKRDILVQHIDDAKRIGVRVLPPNVNTDDVTFDVQNGQILFGLTAIKGIGRSAALQIVRARREGGPFRDIYEFCERIDHRIVSRAGLERLIKAGACDSLGGHRAALMAALPRALQSAGELQNDRRHGQMNFFDAIDGDSAAGTSTGPAATALPDVPEWSDSEKLKNEKEALDFYITSHPLAQYEDVIGRFSSCSIDQVANLGINQEVIIGGMMTVVRYLHTKRARNGNTRYARFRLEDFTGNIECVCWPDDFLRYKDNIREDHICFVRGMVERTREEPGLIITRVLSIEQAERELSRGLVVRLDLADHMPDQINAVAGVLRRTPGSCPVYLQIVDQSGKRLMLKTSEDFRINPATVSTSELEMLLGPGRVKFSAVVNGSRNGGKLPSGGSSASERSA
jgi:DNA polymerase-3 subunit alpha